MHTALRSAEWHRDSCLLFSLPWSWRRSRFLQTLSLSWDFLKIYLQTTKFRSVFKIIFLTVERIPFGGIGVFTACYQKSLCRKDVVLLVLLGRIDFSPFSSINKENCHPAMKCASAFSQKRAVFSFHWMFKMFHWNVQNSAVCEFAVLGNGKGLIY